MVGLLMIALLLNSLLQLHCLSADEGSLSLTYNGGDIMTQPVTVSLLWFGDGWQESGTEAVRNAIISLTPTRYPNENSEVPTLGNWWEIVRQYRDSSNVPVTDRVDVGAECFYTGPHLNLTLDQVHQIGQAVFNKTSVDGLAGNLSCTQVFEANDNTIYHFMFSDDVMFAIELEDLMNTCTGNFEVEVFEGMTVKMLWARSPMNAGDQCSGIFHGETYLGPPNGDEKIDSLVGYMLAKIAEEVTNRDGKGWSSNEGSGLSVSSVCTSLLEGGVDTAPLFRDDEQNVSFNVVGLKGYRYMVQHIWDQQISNCALKLSEPCGTNTVISTQLKGHLGVGISVNHTAGLQPYPPNQKCQWNIQFPTAKFISFTFKYVTITADGDDHLMICKSDLIPEDCYEIQSTDRNLKLTSTKAYIDFSSGSHVPMESRGWELSYSTGLCNGKEDIYDQYGVIDYTPPVGFTYVEGLSCQWVLHGKPGTPVSLRFTHINISKDFDYLAIYNSIGQRTATQIRNFSGLFFGSRLPQINLTGEVMIAFSTQTDNGTGWSANFYISSPISQGKSPLIIVIIVLAVVLISSSLAFITLALHRMRKKLRNRRKMNERLQLIEDSREENLIAEGSSAIVYRRTLADGSMVAIKSQRETMSPTDLEEEILLRASSHPNIISLIGYTLDRAGKRHLVFEFMSRGTLSWNLRERGGTLGWEKRLAIALQVSSALQLLHMYSKPPIYHGNLGSENVLLDEHWNAKLGGFGSANFCKNDALNPNKPSEMAADIRSFGLLLVELLRGDTLVSSNSEFPKHPNESNELLGGQECLDPRLQIPQDECKIMGLAKLGEIANWCISTSQRIGHNTSPQIGDIVSGLRQVQQLFCSSSSQ